MSFRISLDNFKLYICWLEIDNMLITNLKIVQVKFRVQRNKSGVQMTDIFKYFLANTKQLL